MLNLWIPKIKHYLYIGLGLLVSGLLIVVKILTSQNSRLRRKVETADAKVEHAKAVMRADNEAEIQFDERTKKLAEDLEKDGTSDELKEPNKW